MYASEDTFNQTKCVLEGAETYQKIHNLKFCPLFEILVINVTTKTLCKASQGS